MDKAKFLGSTTVFAQTPRFTLKLMEPKYKADFIRTLNPIRWTSDIEVIKNFYEECWSELNNKNNITFSILDSASEMYIGYCQYKKIGTDKPDIGIELLPSHRGKGIGFEVCSILIEKFFLKTEFHSLYYLVRRQNTASIALAEKLGAKRCGMEHVYDQLLSTIASLTPEEKADFTNVENFVSALVEFKDEIIEDEYPTDILIYKIERKD